MKERGMYLHFRVKARSSMLAKKERGEDSKSKNVGRVYCTKIKPSDFILRIGRQKISCFNSE